MLFRITHIHQTTKEPTILQNECNCISTDCLMRSMLLLLVYEEYGMHTVFLQNSNAQANSTLSWQIGMLRLGKKAGNTRLQRR